jgi:hypothetical protein
MQAMKTGLPLITGVLAFTVLGAVASAQEQPWLQDRRYTEGIGIRTGDLELHPGLAGEVGYDSNYLHRASDNYGGPIGYMRERITGSFSLATLSKQRRDATPGAPPPDFEFRAGAHGTLELFEQTNAPGVCAAAPLGGLISTATCQPVAVKPPINFGGGADVALSILPGRAWSGNLYATYTHAVQPSEIALPSASFDRELPNAGAELVWTPGGGLLDWRLGYRFAGTVFDDATDLQGLDNINNEIELRGRWRFLPRTALIYDARFGFISYFSPSPIGSATSADFELASKTSSHPVRSLLGINGLVTQQFGLLAMVGWGASFYSASQSVPGGCQQAPGTVAVAGCDNFDSVIGQIEARWFLTPNPGTDPAAATLTLSSIAVGFTRDFADSYIGDYFESDRGYANLSYFFGGKYLVTVNGGVAAIRYPDVPSAAAEVASSAAAGTLLATAFTDVRADATVFGEWRFRDSFAVNATVRYGGNISNTKLQLGGTATGTPCTSTGVPVGCGVATAPFDLAWRDISAYIGVRWFM